MASSPVEQAQMQVKSGNVLHRRRVIHINRVDMLPFQQDIYDDHDRVETVATYEDYKDYGDQKFPSTITIKRPLEEYSLKIVVTKLTLRVPPLDFIEESE